MFPFTNSLLNVHLNKYELNVTSTSWQRDKTVQQLYAQR